MSNFVIWQIYFKQFNINYFFLSIRDAIFVASCHFCHLSLFFTEFTPMSLTLLRASIFTAPLPTASVTWITEFLCNCTLYSLALSMVQLKAGELNIFCTL